MFLNSLRAKSIYRKIIKEVKARSYSPLNKKIRTVAILQKEGKTLTPASVLLLQNALGVHSKDVIVMTLVKKIEKKDQFNTTIFAEKQIGWNGVLKSSTLKDFTKRDFDVLISYYNTDTLPLVAISAFSKAKFKVGLSEELSTMNDLVINTPIGNEKVLITEMKKYMHILNIID